MYQREKQEELNKKWKIARPEYSNFVSDGILNYEKYSNSNPKIMFLLKESNDNFCNIAPLKENENGYGPKGNSNTFWRFMRGYEFIIQQIWDGEIDYNPAVLKAKEKPNINTAYVNVKKQCQNKPTSAVNNLIEYASNDKDFLKEQIEIIYPDVIFCAGTINLFKIIFEECEPVSEKIYLSENRIIIDYLHLAHRKGYKTFEELRRILICPKVLTLISKIKSK